MSEMNRSHPQYPERDRLQRQADARGLGRRAISNLSSPAFEKVGGFDSQTTAIRIDETPTDPMTVPIRISKKPAWLDELPYGEHRPRQ